MQSITACIFVGRLSLFQNKDLKFVSNWNDRLTENCQY